jgi:hypothetical protein
MVGFILDLLGWISRFIWELPQTYLGLVISIFLGRPTLIYKGSFVTYSRGFGVSLGAFVFVIPAVVFEAAGYDDPNQEQTNGLLHEHGHTIQSRLLGPLYLLVVGLPSLVMNLMSTYSMLYGKRVFYNNYYKRFPENWADRLGGVHRVSP